MYEALPLQITRAFYDADPDTIFETCWASYVPLHAAAKIGKVHLTSPAMYPHTFCGISIVRPSRRLFPTDHDPRCTRCAKSTFHPHPHP